MMARQVHIDLNYNMIPQREKRGIWEMESENMLWGVNNSKIRTGMSYIKVYWLTVQDTGVTCIVAINSPI